jgi:hypothetical protein
MGHTWTMTCSRSAAVGSRSTALRQVDDDERREGGLKATAWGRRCSGRSMAASAKRGWFKGDVACPIVHDDERRGGSKAVGLESTVVDSGSRRSRWSRREPALEDVDSGDAQRHRRRSGSRSRRGEERRRW